jgi:hypothetical protein
MIVTQPRRAVVVALALWAAMTGSAVHAADPDPDAGALALESAPIDPPAASGGGLKLSLEAAVGRAWLRGQGAEHRSLRRGSVDVVYATRFAPQWQFVFSDRVDALHPHDGDATVNSLRELYVGWQDPAAQWAAEVGRVNLRQGPALGFNPTDFFRDGALRVSTTVNPLLVREYRLGSVMVRAQRMWADGSLSVALSPELDDRPDSEGWSADLGATNARDRLLLSLSTRWSASTSSQLHLYAERGGRPQVGASLSSLLGDATVLYAEWAWSREPSLLHRAQGQESARQSGHRAAAGLTYSTSTRLSLTAELEYNDFALSSNERKALATAAPALFGAYFFEAQRRQDLAARRSVMLYAKQTDAVWRNLDLTALVRTNPGDRSTMGWLEVRYHFPNVDLSLQALQYRGRAGSEYGSSPYRRSVQALATVYF